VVLNGGHRTGLDEHCRDPQLAELQFNASAQTQSDTRTCAHSQ
jgi:hypothetical protein